MEPRPPDRRRLHARLLLPRPAPAGRSDRLPVVQGAAVLPANDAAGLGQYRLGETNRQLGVVNAQLDRTNAHLGNVEGRLVETNTKLAGGLEALGTTNE